MLFANFMLCIQIKLITSAGQLMESFLQTHCHPVWKLAHRLFTIFGISEQEELGSDVKRLNDECCPLCLGVFTDPFIATCGHAYCGI